MPPSARYWSLPGPARMARPSSRSKSSRLYLEAATPMPPTTLAGGETATLTPSWPGANIG